jgi:hypothetical protein
MVVDNTRLQPTQKWPEGHSACTEQSGERPSFQHNVDRLIAAVFLWAFPRWVRPNHLTALRFILIPVVLVLLHLELRWWALAVFIVATCTDFIDGAMARTRGQITVLGTYADPVADKL